MGWGIEHIRQQMEIGKELGRKKRLEHEEKIKNVKEKFKLFRRKDENDKK